MTDTQHEENSQSETLVVAAGAPAPLAPPPLDPAAPAFTPPTLAEPSPAASASTPPTPTAPSFAESSFAASGAGESGAAGAGASEQEPAGEPAKPKRRIGGGKLFAGALVLGVLGGVGTGYAVQASRPATPLPPLASTQPQYLPVGVYQGIAPALLPASQDDATLTEGDLTKLLLPTPSGANDEDSTWTDQMIGLNQDAYLCADQAHCYEQDYQDGVEALADTEWTTSDGFFVEIRMYRFAAGDSDSGRSWVGENSADGSTPISMPNGIDASGFEYRDSYGDNDDHAKAVHGDILVSFWVSSPTKTPDPSLIDGIITQQMGRL